MQHLMALCQGRLKAFHADFAGSHGAEVETRGPLIRGVLGGRAPLWASLPIDLTGGGPARRGPSGAGGRRLGSVSLPPSAAGDRSAAAPAPAQSRRDRLTERSRISTAAGSSHW